MSLCRSNIPRTSGKRLIAIEGLFLSLTQRAREGPFQFRCCPQSGDLESRILRDCARKRVIAGAAASKTGTNWPATFLHGKRGSTAPALRGRAEGSIGRVEPGRDIIILWKTLYINALLHQIAGKRPFHPARRHGAVLPLVFEHITLLGRYAFSVPDSVVRGQLRPLFAIRPTRWRMSPDACGQWICNIRATLSRVSVPLNPRHPIELS